MVGGDESVEVRADGGQRQEETHSDGVERRLRR